MPKFMCMTPSKIDIFIFIELRYGSSVFVPCQIGSRPNGYGPARRVVQTHVATEPTTFHNDPLCTISNNVSKCFELGTQVSLPGNYIRLGHVSQYSHNYRCTYRATFTPDCTKCRCPSAESTSLVVFSLSLEMNPYRISYCPSPFTS